MIPTLFYPFLSVLDGAASLFRWSADGKYLARKGKDLISIYELPSMRLLDKKSLKVQYEALGCHVFLAQVAPARCTERVDMICA